MGFADSLQLSPNIEQAGDTLFAHMEYVLILISLCVSVYRNGRTWADIRLPLQRPQRRGVQSQDFLGFSANNATLWCF